MAGEQQHDEFGEGTVKSLTSETCLGASCLSQVPANDGMQKGLPCLPGFPVHQIKL